MDHDELLDAEADVAACRRADSRARALHTELAAEQQAVQALRRRLDDERDDVRKASGSSVRSLVARLRGRRDDLLSSERADVVAAESELAVHQAAMRRLSAQFDEARTRAQQLDAAEAALADAIERREQTIAAGDSERAARLRDLDRSLTDARAERDDFRAVHGAALGAVGALDRAVESLSIAQGWSTVDTFLDGDGRSATDWISGTAKHEQLDRSVEPVAEAHAALLQLRATLSESGADRVHRPNVRTPSTGLARMDLWFDNFFSDMMVHERISSSISELERAARSVDDLIEKITPHEQAATQHVEQLEGERSRLLRDG